MSDQDRLRQYYADLSDGELRESFAAGPEDYGPAVWQIIGEQMAIRQLDAHESPEIPADADVPLVATPLTPRVVLQRRVEEGGAVALVIAAVCVIGACAAVATRFRLRFFLFALAIALVYAISGVLMRRSHSLWAAAICELLLVANYAESVMLMAKQRQWGYLAVSVLLYGPPIYWLLRACLAALSLRTADRVTASVSAPLH
jgi:hypothetical protein